MTGSPPDLAGTSGDELKRLLLEALEKIAALTAENAALRAEIARLKGLKGPPTFKPSGMEKASTPPKPPGKGGRGGGGGGGRSARMALVEDRVVAVAVPAGSRLNALAFPSEAPPEGWNATTCARPKAAPYLAVRWSTALPPGLSRGTIRTQQIMVELADRLESALQLLVVGQPATHLADLFAGNSELARAPSGIAHRQNRDRVSSSTRAFRAAAGMANQAIQKRAAQDLTGDREFAEKLLPCAKGLITRHV